jgi:hypothetical protein
LLGLTLSEVFLEMSSRVIIPTDTAQKSLIDHIAKCIAEQGKLLSLIVVFLHIKNFRGFLPTENVGKI